MTPSEARPRPSVRKKVVSALLVGFVKSQTIPDLLVSFESLRMGFGGRAAKLGDRFSRIEALEGIGTSTVLQQGSVKPRTGYPMSGKVSQRSL